MILRSLAAMVLGLVSLGCAPQNLGYEDILERDVLIEEETRYFSGATLLALETRVLQIEYHSPDSKAYLWYPGNPAVNVGQWDVRPRRDSMELMLCYRYQTSTNTKPFGSRGDGATCSAISRSKRHNWYVGDPYNLQSGRVPFNIPRLPSNQTTGPQQLDLVIERTDINPINLRKKQ